MIFFYLSTGRDSAGLGIVVRLEYAGLTPGYDHRRDKCEWEVVSFAALWSSPLRLGFFLSVTDALIHTSTSIVLPYEVLGPTGL